MQRAVELSMANPFGGPFGAVIVSDEGKIVGEGQNQVTDTCDPTAHAEVQAVRNACRNLNRFHLTGCTIYTSCEPCPMCLSAIYWARISKIVYGNTRKDAADIGFDDDFIYNEIGLHPKERSIPAVQSVEHEPIKAFHQWRNNTERISY